jgi:sarcosine oxidase subunit alpha
VGACRGSFSISEALQDAVQAGVEAARQAGFESGARVTLPQLFEPKTRPILVVWPSSALRGRSQAFVDFQNDVTSADIALAAREGFVAVEHLKRYTTTGMATDQGKTANLNALALLSEITGKSIPETGVTTFRPPYTPVTFGALAGRDLGDRLEPIRVTAIQRWHIERGARFENVGQWKRPWYYPRQGEDLRRAVERECKATRMSVGVLDASTLGKIEAVGPDAAEFLDRIYVNDMRALAVGRCRYGLMCTENGMVFDDGVVTRLAQDRFFVTTTTAGAGRVLDWLEEWLQTEWRDLRVYLTSVTEQWATIALAGPNAREVLQRLGPDFAFDQAAFPFLACREGRVAGVAARVFRVSFTGELSYELSVPAEYALAMWEAVMDAGRPFDITPYGTETMHVLRAEKGIIIVGQDTDGSVTPVDLGLERMVKARDFLGRRSLRRSDTGRPDRKQLVGLLPEDPDQVLLEGAQVIAADAPRPRARRKQRIAMLGHVTSSYWSANLKRSFGLALVKGGRARIGEWLWVFGAAGAARAQIVEPVFWDPAGVRRNG